MKSGMKGLVVLGGLGFVAYEAKKVLDREGRKTEDDFEAVVLQNVAAYLKSLGSVAPSERLFDALKLLVDGGRVEQEVRNILRLEMEVEKESATLCDAIIRIAREEGGEVLRGELRMSRVPWDKLPQNMRSEFIRSGERRLTYLMYERTRSAAD